MKDETKSKGGELYTTIQFEGITNPIQRAFLAAFSVVGKPGKAAVASGVPRQTHYFWLRTDPAYRKAFDACRDNIADHLEDALVERLIFGWKEPVYQNGQLVGYKRKFDNATAWKMLQKLRPEIYGDSQDEGETDENEFVIDILQLPDNGRG